MTRGLDLTPKRTRESTSKVRTGCSTCKARRVKCDEATPQCRRCSMGGRKCEYSIIRTAATRNWITIYLPPTQSPAVLFVNDRGLEFFQQNLATMLDGQLNSDSEFWGKFVLQLSHSEPSIRHAVSAISLCYRDVESSLRDPAGYVNANPEVQKEWNKAIKSLSVRIQAHPNSSLVPLVCCLLFTCIEFLKGNAESSMLHIQNGFKILATQVCDSDTDSERRSNFSSNDLASIKSHIVPMFSRLNILCTLAGRTTPQLYSTTTRTESPPESLADSRRQLFGISDTCFRFIRETSPKVAMLQADFQDIIDQTKLQIRLDAWHAQVRYSPQSKTLQLFCSFRCGHVNIATKHHTLKRNSQLTHSYSCTNFWDDCILPTNHRIERRLIYFWCNIRLCISGYESALQSKNRPQTLTMPSSKSLCITLNRLQETRKAEWRHLNRCPLTYTFWGRCSTPR